MVSIRDRLESIYASECIPRSAFEETILSAAVDVLLSPDGDPLVAQEILATSRSERCTVTPV